MDLAIPEEIHDSEEVERLEGMRRRDSLVKELGLSEQVAASLLYKTVPHTLLRPVHKGTSLLPYTQHNDACEPESEYESSTYSKTSDPASPLRRRAVPLSADIHNPRSFKPYSKSLCRTEPSYYGMGIQRSSSSQAVSRIPSRGMSRYDNPHYTRPRQLYYAPPPQPQNATLHKLLSTYGHGFKAKPTNTTRSHKWASLKYDIHFCYVLID